MLDVTLATQYLPGTNVRGQVAGANWLFLLPRLHYERVLCLGRPPASALATLTSRGREVVIVEPTPARRQASDPANVRSITPQPAALEGLAAGSVDCLVILGAANVRHFCGQTDLFAGIQRSLQPGGVLYCEATGPAGLAPVERWLQGLAGTFGAPRRYWLSPLHGETQTAVLLEDSATSAYLVEHQLFALSMQHGPVRPLEAWLFGQPGLRRAWGRQALVAECAPAAPGAGVPAYVQQAAQQAGLDLDGYRWALLARGRFSTRKVLFYLFKEAADTPEYIVKLTRTPSLSLRLENAHRALCALRTYGLGEGERYPRPVFHGQHANLALTGETVIQGAPMRRPDHTAPERSVVLSATDWLTELGAATAVRADTSSAQMAQVLRLVLVRFVQLYQWPRERVDFLERQIHTLAGSPALPAVFQHGDPGVWNIVVNHQGQAAFLDWEAAELKGLPLWDLFYFLRSYGSAVARQAGERDSLRAFASQFLAPGPASPLIIETVERYRQRVGVPAECTAALFYTCWMHRALKEVTRLRSGQLERGSYVNLLRLAIDQRQSPTLRRLFGEKSGGLS